MKRFLKAVVVVLVLLVVVALGAAGYGWMRLRGSLPVLDGTRAVAGLSVPVIVARDGLGVPTLTGASRRDVSRALGYVHAQDRFFQMDLQRRQPAGELSALVGDRAFDADAQVRVHRFRGVVADAYRRADAEWRDLLDAYAAGVNAGFADLDAPPFEYALLGATPEPWKPEDSLLVVLAMFGTLQGRQAQFEQTNQQLRDALPEPMFRFLSVAGSAWDAPAAGGPIQRPPMPGPEVIDLRARSVRRGPPRGSTSAIARGDTGCDTRAPLPWLQAPCTAEEASTIGSNNWAVDATRSASGTALVANDMHLGIGVPNIWYRAAMVFPDAENPAQSWRLAGVTLPGLPVLVVGSNGHVAWGFTNTGGDWSDLVRIDPDPRDGTRYLTPDGPRAFDVTEEKVAIKGGPERSVTVRSTIWGPIVWKDAAGREYAQHWVAGDAGVMSGNLARSERARTVEETFAAVAGLGLPHQNVTVGDRAGRIGWIVGGAIPRRRGLDGFTPESWADGTRGWDGYLAPEDYPRILDPETGRIWTANAPVVDGTRLQVLGDGGYADGIRARIIRDRLMAIDRATPLQMLEVQKDDQALFLDRWKTLLLSTLDAAPPAATPEATATRQEFRRLVATTWTGKASLDSVSYRLVRTFRAQVVRLVMDFVTAPAKEKDPGFDHRRTGRAEGPVWQLVTERPMHLLDPRYSTWHDLVVAAVDAAAAELTEGGRTLDGRTWGEFNRAQVVHPLAAALPVVNRWLNMPDDPLPGDVFTPRAHSPRTGPSERMVVSPGREEEGILHMPTGQSAHPLSPHFGDMHRAWVTGEPVPFLPGPTVHTLTLTP